MATPCEPLRTARAAVVERFTDRPCFVVRATTARVLADEVDRLR